MATSTRQDIHFTPERQQRFLDLLADAHSLSGAAKLVGVHRDTVYDRRQSDPAFNAAVDRAIKQRGDWWEECLRQLGDRDKPDTLAVIIGLKKEGRFIEPQYQQKLQVNVNVSAGPFQDYTVDQLRALLARLEAPVVEGEVIEVKAPLSGEGLEDSDAIQG